MWPSVSRKVNNRVPTLPGKSWVSPLIFQALESPGKFVWFWKVLEIEA